MAGALWGFSATCAQYIFDTFGADPTYLTSIRLLISGVILVAVGFICDRKNMIKAWDTPKIAVQLIIYGIGGLMFMQITYMKCISYSNSGTATILSYIGPVLIMIATCFLEKKLPKRIEVFAIVMVLAGTFIIATHGDIHSMVITPRALFWGLLSAVAMMFYTMLPVNVSSHCGSIATTGYAMLIGGLFLSLIGKAWNAPMIYDARCIIAFIAIVIFGTILSFTLYVLGISLCGPVKGSIVASIEPVSATVLMVVWLKEPFQVLDLAGFACIFVTVFLLTKKDGEKMPPADKTTGEESA